jgi:hypothetical protein
MSENKPFLHVSDCMFLAWYLLVVWRVGMALADLQAKNEMREAAGVSPLDPASLFPVPWMGNIRETLTNHFGPLQS